MSRTSWIASLYGYLVCIIAVITFLISTSGFIDAAFDRANPLQSRGGMYGPMGASLASFEAFRATNNERERTFTRTRDGVSTERIPLDTPSTAELRSRYEALRADNIARATYSASQRLVKHGLLILVAVALFVWHWRWLRTQRETATP